ncbi:MAG: ShlB/FhaC/HecB family hemolysin secretion/activation protein [Nostoc sp. DedSLP03]|uniref:ShlB/FhaC/HecB family hemolysin secretion/activation protein n=1 Tax=Nostoc sp. DedSLP03 TaxID=3075400 RepID=UPI002AD22C87|nr:ShlB/FhaC/HecB family hemolysin secretion/activation protein [Nostoc sp. DedSLP03]MDZ7966431.1 ShlB/FhaC/HecB family hemolysin secretion/activation protein [Nostoc sp. DedSLP03]
MNIKHYIFLQLVFVFTPSTALANPTNKLISTEAIKLVQLNQPDTVNPLKPANTPIIGIIELNSPTPPSSQNPTVTPRISQSASPLLPICPPLKQSPNGAANEQRQISKIVVSFSDQQKKLISDSDAEKVLQQLKFKNCPATLERLSAIKDAITLLYIERGYITSRAESAEIGADGTVTVRIIEGKIRDVFVTDYEEKRIEDSRKHYVHNRVKLGIETPFNIRKLEEQIKLLEIDPLFDEDDPLCKKIQPSQSQSLCAQKNVDAILTLRKPGETDEKSDLQEGESYLIIKVKKTRFFQANFSFDNSSPPSVGAERLRADLSIANLARFGDIFVTSFEADPFHFSTEDGFNAVSLGYQIPVNPKNSTLQLRFEGRREKIVQDPFGKFDFRAKSELFELTYRQPLVRSYSNEFALSLGFTFQNGQTFVFNDTPFPFGIGPDKDGVSRTSVIKFAQDYIHRGNSGTWVLRSQFSFGTELFDATNNRNSIPDGNFISWLGQLQWLQQLGNDNLLIMQTDLQLTPDTLLPSQQYVIGGSQSLRGYRQNVRFGDNGFRFSLENRITLQRNEARKPTLQIAPFFDMGTVWNQSGNPNKLTGDNFLAGAGLGVLWQPFPQLNMRLDYAIPLVELRNRGDNLQDKGLYFSINYKP